MRSIKPPVFDVKLALDLCADNVRDKSLSLRLLSSLNDIVAAETDYISKGGSCQLYSIAEAISVGDWVDASEMQALYTKTFARKGSPARYIYEVIRASAPGGICPLCNQRPVSTLDHHLAKSRHPALTITPINLVPACKDCNTDSRARRPKSASEQTLHPYFDIVDDEVWLTASVMQSKPPAIIFSVAPPTKWSLDKQAMVRAHFDAFRLSALYTTHAAGELVNIYFDVVSAGHLQHAGDLQAHFRELAGNRRHVVKNSWQAAMYQGLADSQWFCTVGYQEIARSLA